MATSLYPQIYDKFLGIREYNGVNSNGIISAIKANNIDLYQSDIGSGIGIKSTKGNKGIYELPEGYKIIDIFSSQQDKTIYDFIYAENDTKGTLFYANPINNATIIIDDLPLSAKANGLTMTSSAYDVFIFTNGKKQYSVCFSKAEKVKEINAVDFLGRNISWLAMWEWNGFLVVSSEYGVHASHQNDIYTWNDNPQDKADSWYIDFSKKVTAIVGFSAGLFIFTDSDVTRLLGNPNTSNSSLELVSMNGTLSYQSIAIHDTYLFFYDPKQKNIYYMQITDTGQTRPSGPVAKEVQSYFNKSISKFKMCSCIYSGNNEIWCLIDDKILIYDYTKQEWLRRTEQNINCVCLSDNQVLTGGDSGIVYLEKINNDFNEQFFPSEYRTTFINMGSNSNLKKQKTPLLICLNDNELNDFWVELTVNNKQKNPKRVKITVSCEAVYGNSNDVNVIPKNETYEDAYYAADNPYSKRIIEISTPQTWYTLGIRFYTDQAGQGFAINSIELKNVKAKTKTKGR